MDKQETVDNFGKDQVLVWRRSYDVPPPTVDPSNPHHPRNDERYNGSDFPEEFTESLATTLDRVVPYFESEIAPQIKEGKTVMVAAHGNSLRALVKHLDGIDESTIAELNIPTGTPLVYTLDENLKPIPHADAISPLQGRYLGDQDAIRARSKCTHPAPGTICLLITHPFLHSRRRQESNQVNLSLRVVSIKTYVVSDSDGMVPPNVHT